VQGGESEARKQQLNIKSRDERVVKVKSRAWNNALCCSEWLGVGSRRAGASANVNWPVRFEAFVDLIVETKSRRPQNTKSKYATIKVRVKPQSQSPKTEEGYLNIDHYARTYKTNRQTRHSRWKMLKRGVPKQKSPIHAYPC
tara:strand:+ start:106 stop:531 length:426 start_codon:yes stop_codon:yes gene_type:complete